jgi:hypothetical protein
MFLLICHNYAKVNKEILSWRLKVLVFVVVCRMIGGEFHTAGMLGPCDCKERSTGPPFPTSNLVGPMPVHLRGTGPWGQH